jgi:hypothetical protein
VYYAAPSLKTAVAESTYAQTRFARQSHLTPLSFDMRIYYAKLAGELIGLRGLKRVRPELYDAESYTDSARFGVRMRADGEWGICYDSVRDAGGECAAVLRPPVLSNVRQGAHLVYEWDGRSISHYYEKRGIEF